MSPVWWRPRHRTPGPDGIEELQGVKDNLCRPPPFMPTSIPQKPRQVSPFATTHTQMLCIFIQSRQPSSHSLAFNYSF